MRTIFAAARRPRALLAGLCAALLLSIATCVAHAQGQVEKLRYAFAVSSPSLITEPLYAAEKNGDLDKLGLKLDVIWLQGDALALKAVLTDEVDVAWLGTTAAIQAIAKGAKIKIIYGPVPKSSNVILAQKEIATPQDLQGKSIAVSTVGAISYHIPRIIMARARVDPNSANFVALGSTSTRFQAMIAKKVDAGMVDLIQAAEAEQRYPYLHTLASVADKIPDLHFISVIASDKTIATKGPALQRLLKAEIAGMKFVVDHPTEAAKLSFDRMGAKSLANVEAAFQMAAKLNIYGLDGGLGADDLDKTMKLMVETGDLTAPLPIDSVLDRRIVAGIRGN
jgi:ABC-type nitrate/sulfonate/bicarbonate transport system substrate-binding protein